MPTLNDLFRARGIAYGNAKKRSDGYAEKKKAWAQIVRVRARNIKPVTRCTLSYRFIEANKRRDPDNVASAAMKLINDGLVKCGVLPGDGWGFIRGITLTWEVGTEPGVMVTIYEVA